MVEMVGVVGEVGVVEVLGGDDDQTEGSKVS